MVIIGANDRQSGSLEKSNRRCFAALSMTACLSLIGASNRPLVSYRFIDISAQTHPAVCPCGPIFVNFTQIQSPRPPASIPQNHPRHPVPPRGTPSTPPKCAFPLRGAYYLVGRFHEDNLPLGSLTSRSAFTLASAFHPARLRTWPDGHWTDAQSST